MEYDSRRDQWLRREGFVVLRFWNNQVLVDSEGVLESIRETVLSLDVLLNKSRPLPCPSPKRGGLTENMATAELSIVICRTGANYLSIFFRFHLW